MVQPFPPGRRTRKGKSADPGKKEPSTAPRKKKKKKKKIKRTSENIYYVGKKRVGEEPHGPGNKSFVCHEGKFTSKKKPRVVFLTEGGVGGEGEAASM